MNEKTCGTCGVAFRVPNSRVKTAKYCSKACSDAAPRKKNTVFCAECGVEFPLKKSQAERNKVWGSFCGSECNSRFRERMTLGAGNPNYRGRGYDSDGYKMYIPHGKGVLKKHHHVAFRTLGIKKLPKGGHVHHRDCDMMNNEPENLQLISASDHKWLHKEFGSSVLWAMTRNKIDIETLSEWSSDPIRARHLLENNVLRQREVYKALQGDEENILQVLSIKPVRVTFQEVDELTETERGTGGFGSTGA